MTRDKQIGVALVVLAALGGAAYFQQKKDAEVGVSSKGSSDLPSLAGSDDLDKISITNGSKGEFVLAKEGDKWMLQKPVHALANQNNVKSLLDNLKELKTSEVVAGAATDELKKTYDLDSEHAIHLVAWKGADQKVDDTFGKTGSRGEMAMSGDKPGIYAIKGYSISLYNREQKGWRDTEIFKFDGDNVASITIDNSNGNFSFTKGDKWAGTLDGKPIPGFDDAKVSEAIRSLKALNADSFAEASKSPAETGIDAPEGVISVALKDGAGTYTLKVGAVSTGTSHYAEKDGDTTVVVVNPTASGWALADGAKFAKAAADAGAAAPKPAPSAATAKLGKH